MPFSVTYTDPSALSDRQLLLLILERLTTMSQVADTTAATLTAENAKVDQLLALIAPAFQTLRDALAASQSQAVALQASLTAAQSDAAADAAELTGSIASAVAETAKVQTAIDALTPPPATP